MFNQFKRVMKNLFITTLTALSLIVLAGFIIPDKEGITGEAKSKYGQEMVTILASQKVYTLEILNLMPEDKLAYRPNEEVRSFAELFKHIAGSFQLQQKVLKGEFTTIQEEFPAVQQLEKSEMSKQQIIDLVSSEFDNMSNLLANMSEKDLKKTFTFAFIPGAPEKNYREIFTFSRDHLTHHRGQATTYLRLNGVKPAAYRPW